MKFVQIIEMKTSKPEDVQKLDEEWERASEGKRTSTRVMVLADRDKPDTYFVIAEFPSYEEAMKNNELPETQAFSAKQAALTDEVTFRNLDLIHEWT